MGSSDAVADAEAAPAADRSAEPSLARAIVAAHGELAAGLVSAVAQITGRDDVFLPLSNRGLGGDQLEAVLRAVVAERDAHVVFTDLPSGSWTIAARRVQRDMPSLVVVTGANLAALLAWTFRSESDAVGDAARAAVERGLRAMVVSGGAGGH
jgi:N-acetylgalactosamine PTS system EIIA component